MPQTQYPKQFELNDDTVLLLNGAAMGSYAVECMAMPGGFSSRYVSGARNDMTAGWIGQACAITSAQSIISATNDNFTPGAKKALLKAHAVWWATAGARALYNSRVKDTQPQSLYVNAFVCAAPVMAGLNAYFGFQGVVSE